MWIFGVTWYVIIFENMDMGTNKIKQNAPNKHVITRNLPTQGWSLHKSYLLPGTVHLACRGPSGWKVGWNWRHMQAHFLLRITASLNQKWEVFWAKQQPSEAFYVRNEFSRICLPTLRGWFLVYHCENKMEPCSQYYFEYSWRIRLFRR